MKRFWQLANIFALAFALFANGVVGAQLLSLPSINDVSDSYATFLTPAGYAFSIWSVIYALLIVFVVYQARDLFRPRKENVLPQKVGPFFIVASVCNGLWTYVFVNDLIGLSVVILLTLTVSLYILLYRLRIAIDNPPFSVIFCVWWPLLLYTGWVTIASIVNVASWFDSLGLVINAVAASGVIVIAGAILAGLLYKRNVRELLLACSWGIAGIGLNQGESSDGKIVAFTAFATVSVLLVLIAIHGYMNRQSSPLYKS